MQQKDKEKWHDDDKKEQAEYLPVKLPFLLPTNLLSNTISPFQEALPSLTCLRLLRNLLMDHTISYGILVLVSVFLCCLFAGK